METKTGLKEEILLHLNNPAQVERLYRKDQLAFKKAFNSLYPSLQDNKIGEFWNERLNFSKDEISWGSNKELMVTILACVLAALIVKIPALFSINEEFFYPRNLGFVIFPALSAYFAWKNNLSVKQCIFIILTIVAAAIFINLLPKTKSDTLVLSCIHLALFLWAILGIVFCSDTDDPVKKRLSYLQFNGDLIVMTALILISGAILTGLTIGLFSLIELNIEEFYFNNIAIVGLASAPIVGTYLVQTNPQLVNRISPVIAKIFSPLVLVMLVIYLTAIIFSGKDPYNDREFLLMFNLLLIGVMAIIFFSVAENTKNDKNRFGLWIIFLLAIVTVVVNGLALSAIVFRITEWGITPNRTAVLGSNLLMLVNLLLIVPRLYQVLFRQGEVNMIGKVTSSYIPIYVIWTIIVTFIFPFIFGFK